MKKRFKRLNEGAELPVHDTSTTSELPELRKEEEEELKLAVAEADEKELAEDGVGLPADSNTSKEELPEGEDKEDELKLESEDEDEDDMVDEDEDFEVDLSDLEEDGEMPAKEDEVKKEAEEKEDEIKTEDEDKADDEKLTEEDEKDAEEVKTEADEKDDEKVAVEAAEEILAKEDELPADLKEKARTIIEATVNALVTKKLARKNKKLKESYLRKLKEIKAKTEAKYTHNLNKYTNYVVNNWLNENTIAIESGIRVNLAEKVMNSFKSILEANSIVVPANKVNLVESQEKKISALNEELENQIDLVQKLQEKLGSFEKEKIIDDGSKDLSLEQKTRLKRICENVTFESPEKFAKKVSYLKESYLTSKTTTRAKDLDSGIVNDGGIKNAVAENKNSPLSGAIDLLSKARK